MSFALIRLFLGGAIKNLIAWLSHRSFCQLVCMGLGALLLIQHFQLTGARHSAVKWEHQFNAERKARADDRAAYTNAQATAAVQNKAQVAKVERQYQRNSDDERQSYLDDLARLRRMRVQPSAQSASGSTGSPPPHASATGADANGLPVPASDDVQAAAEIELRLMHLQNYVEKQLSVDPNAP